MFTYGNFPQALRECPRYPLVKNPISSQKRTATLYFRSFVYPTAFDVKLPGRRMSAGDKDKKGTFRMANGTVKWFNSTKGFGFIEVEGRSNDVFVHISAVERSGLTGLADGQAVTFEIQSGRDGRESASDLQLA